MEAVSGGIKKICPPPNWGMRAGAFVATIHPRLSEQPAAPFFDTRSGLPLTPGRRPPGGIEVLV
ncbi:MAG: hypothetical protein ACRECZ_05920, partial [Methylocella sp.]